MARSKRASEASSTYGLLFCTVVLLLASIVMQARNSALLDAFIPKMASSTKPYATFEQFYPHYLREHSQQTTRQWHYFGTTLVVLYLLSHPVLLLPILAGGLSAYASMPFFRNLSTGVFEIVILMVIYLIGGKLLTGSLKKTFAPLLLGYGFAWVGHFYFEHNKPATFVYPTFSLLGDFRMLFDAVRQLRF